MSDDTIVLYAQKCECCGEKFWDEHEYYDLCDVCGPEFEQFLEDMR